MLSTPERRSSLKSPNIMKNNDSSNSLQRKQSKLMITIPNQPNPQHSTTPTPTPNSNNHRLNTPNSISYVAHVDQGIISQPRSEYSDHFVPTPDGRLCPKATGPARLSLELNLQLQRPSGMNRRTSNLLYCSSTASSEIEERSQEILQQRIEKHIAFAKFCELTKSLMSSSNLTSTKSNPKIMTTPSGKPIPPRPRKLALLGSRSVGKSSLAVHFVDDHFVESYYPTIEHTFQKTVEFKGQLFHLELFDTAGHDEFTILDSKQAIGLDGWALVYSINSRSSFDMVSIIRDKILNFTGQDSVPMVLIGNKSDLEAQRQISREEGAALAKSFRCAFTEASARSGVNVHDCFMLGLEEVEKEINPESAKPENSKCIIC